METNAQAAAYYFARKRNRNARPLTIALTQKTLTIGHQTLAADLPVSQVGTLLDQNGKGSNSFALSGTNASDFKLTGRVLSLKSGSVLAAGLLVVEVTVTNTVLGTATTQFQVTVT